MRTLSRFTISDCLVGAILAAGLALEMLFIWNLTGTTSPALPGMVFLSSGILALVMLFNRVQGWRWDRKGVGVWVAGASFMVMGIGVLGVFHNSPGAPIVSLGFVFALALGYSIWRLDRAGRTTSTREERREPVAVAVREGASAADLEGIDILRGLTPSERELVARIARRAHVTEGARLTEARGAAGVIYCIRDGQAELHARSAMGQITVRIAQEGESFPLAALVGSQTAITDARAMGAMDVIEIPVEALRALCAQHPEMGMKLYAAIAGILADRYRTTLDRLTGSMQETLRRVDFWANV